MTDAGWSEALGAARRHNLDAPLTSIIGRDRDLEAVCWMLRGGDARLLTLTGHGGIGKTRIALEAAHRLVDTFEDGVCWVDLGTLRDPSQVPSAIVMALRLRESGGRDSLDTLVEALRDRHLLLVLDNVEQVRGAAPVIGRLLAQCPGLRVLATGRTPLALRGEQRYAIEPLELPGPEPEITPERILATPACVLFVERARAIQPGFTITAANAPVVAEVCRRLDGLPLAIELAASQGHLLPVEALLDRLGQRLPLVDQGAVDVPDRQRTMEQTIAWSHDLLTPGEQDLFRRLAVFEGGFSLEAALPGGAGVGDAPDAEVLASLSSLVTHSLVRRVDSPFGEPRYAMLELTRAHALDRLAESGELAEVRQRHAGHFLDLAARAEEGLRGAEAADWLRRLDQEHFNLRAALEWSIETGHPAAVGRLAVVLGQFWFTRGYLSEGRSWLERALEALGDAPIVERVDAMRALGAIAGAQGDHACEATLARGALALARSLGDGGRIAWCLHASGASSHRRGEVIEARQMYDEALIRFRQVEDWNGLAATLNNLGLVAAEQGDAGLSRRYLDEALAVYRRQGNQRGTAIALCNVGQRVAGLDGNEAAIGHYSEALALFHSLGDTAGIAWGLQAVAEVIVTGDPPRAARLFGAAESLRERMGWSFPRQQLTEYSSVLDLLRERLDEPALSEAWEAGRSLTVEQAIIEASARAVEKDAAPRAALPGGLSEREAEVLRLVAAGLPSALIAEELYLSTHTVNSHLRRIYRKLGVSSRSAATRFALDHGIA